MTTRKVSPEKAAKILRDLDDKLEDNEAVEDAMARAILEQAQANAAGHPTPQSRMAAAEFIVQHGTILSLSGGPPGEVAEGSEFGSTIYRQFGPRNQRGYWLLPAAESPNAATIAAGEEALDSEIEAAIRGF